MKKMGKICSGGPMGLFMSAAGQLVLYWKSLSELWSQNTSRYKMDQKTKKNVPLMSSIWNMISDLSQSSSFELQSNNTDFWLSSLWQEMKILILLFWGCGINIPSFGHISHEISLDISLFMFGNIHKDIE